MEKKDKATIDKVAIGEVEDAFLASLDKLSASSEPFSAFLSHLRASEHTEIGQILRLEKKDFDLTWIEKIEEGMPEIDKIVENPRQFIKQERDVIPAVKIKRVSSESIQHLASHSYFVREIDEESGNVTPDKLLSVENEEDLAIYENRFVKTLILKLYTFVSVRYDYLMEHRETRDSEVMTLHNVTEIDGVRYEFDTRVKCSRSSEKEEDRKKHDEVMERIFRIRDHLNFYMGSAFMSALKTARPVRNPIAMTNMIVKNPHYHKAFLLWDFIDHYDAFGVTFQVIEKIKNFDEERLNQIYSYIELGMFLMKARFVNRFLEMGEAETKVIEPKTLLSLDDETFLDDKFDYHAFKRYIQEEKKPGEPPYSQEEIAQMKKLAEERFEKERLYRRLISEYLEGVRQQLAEEEEKEKQILWEEERQRKEAEEKRAYIAKLQREERIAEEKREYLRAERIRSFIREATLRDAKRAYEPSVGEETRKRIEEDGRRIVPSGVIRKRSVKKETLKDRMKEEGKQIVKSGRIYQIHEEGDGRKTVTLGKSNRMVKKPKKGE